MNILQFSTALNELRKSGPIRTNSALTRLGMESLLTDERTIVADGDGFLAILADEDELYRLHFYVRDAEGLSRLTAFLDSVGKTVAADLIGRNDSVQPLRSLLEEGGFFFGDRFVRMNCESPNVSDSWRRTVTEPATHSDVETIRQMIRHEFDPLFAHIPKVEELQSAVDKGEITVVREGNLLVAFAFFEWVAPKMKCLRYFVTSEACRGKGYGGALWASEKYVRSPGMKYYLWLSEQNKTMTFYRRLGFELDGLSDSIMIYEGKKNG